MRREDFVSDLKSLEFLINMSVLMINNDEDVRPEVFDKFDEMATHYFGNTDLEGQDLRVFTGYYKRVLVLAKRLAYFDKLPLERLNKLIGYQDSIVKIIKKDLTQLEQDINYQIEEIKNIIEPSSD